MVQPLGLDRLAASPGPRVRVVTTTEDLERILTTEAPGRVVVEIREADAGAGGWGPYPEAAFERTAAAHGYAMVAREAGGRPANYGWMGPGDRWVRMTFGRQTAPPGPPAVPSSSRLDGHGGFPSADPHDVLDYVDRVLGSGGDMEEANAGAKLIFIACPKSEDPNRRLKTVDELHGFLERPWSWLRDLSLDALARGDAVTAAKLALMCFLWNRVLVVEDPDIQMGALVKAPARVEAQLYEVGFRAMQDLPRETWLGGDLRGSFLVADARPRVAGAIVALGREGVSVDPAVHQAAAAMATA